ncbi:MULTISPECIES: PepSY domain-containing protein [Hyphobacterium]|uniref:PepSY domain-containing protein n=1 Tax=Hyphobacterium vulgare TaxID=1736751 RepID=A0ABV6ZUT5_9PROT
MMKTLITAAALLAGLMLGAAADALQYRQPPDDVRNRYTADEARNAVQSGQVLPALQVIRTVRQRYPQAEVIDAELEQGARPSYIIKILTEDGRRVDVVVDAQSGNILYER